MSKLEEVQVVGIVRGGPEKSGVFVCKLVRRWLRESFSRAPDSLARFVSFPALSRSRGITCTFSSFPRTRFDKGFRK